MIKFLRHLRFNLIKNGKVSNYFKYAIGEIVLVVIGILIALQINNWNEERKLINTQKVYLEQLYEDIDFMYRRYTERLPIIKNTHAIALKGLRVVEACTVNNVNTAYLDTLLIGHQVLSGFYSVHDTYDEMLSANVLASLKNQELKNSIKDFYTTIDFSNSFISYFRSELGRASEIIWKHVAFTYDAQLQLQVSYTLDDICNDMEFKNAIVEVIDSREDYRNAFEQLLNKLTRLRAELSEELSL